VRRKAPSNIECEAGGFVKNIDWRWISGELGTLQEIRFTGEGWEGAGTRLINRRRG
jgi:hypothetical protein